MKLCKNASILVCRTTAIHAISMQVQTTSACCMYRYYQWKVFKYLVCVYLNKTGFGALERQ